MAEAGFDVVVDDPDSLHVGIKDGRAQEFKAAAFEVLTELVRFGSFGRKFLQGFPTVDFCLVAQKPQR